MGSFFFSARMRFRRSQTTCKPDNFELSLNKEQYISNFSDEVVRFNPAGVCTTVFHFDDDDIQYRGMISKRDKLINRRAGKCNRNNFFFAKGCV